MKKIIWKFHWLLGFCIIFMLLSKSAFPGAPAGHPESMEPQLYDMLGQRLYEEGYLSVDPSTEFKRAISAYLWDHREMLIITDFPKSREVDVLICLMEKKEGADFGEYSADSGDLCKQYIRE